jgi:hypothetical protein
VLASTSSSPSNRQAIIKVEICMNFVDLAVDDITVPLPFVRRPLRPYFTTLPGPTIVNAEDATPLNLLTPPTRICSKKKSQ